MLKSLNLKIYSKEAAEKLAKVFASMKEVKGEGTFEVIATTEGIDRDGEVIKVDGWDFKNYMNNPIILWGHNYYDMNAVIGAATSIDIVEGKVIVKGIFANTEAGQIAKQLYDDGILKAVSVGFIPLERNGNVITKAELLELSFVSVPANPEALSLAKIFKLEKIMNIKSEEDEEPAKEEEEDDIKHTLTQEDLDNNPDLVAEGLKVGDEVELSKVKPEETPNENDGQDNPDSGDAETGEEAGEAKGVKSGRVLSAKNLELVDNAISALKALRDASEPEKAVVVEAAKDAVIDMQAMQKILESAIKNAKAVKANI